MAFLEPLADALALSVTGLLRGERYMDTAAEPTVREASRFLYEHAKRSILRNVRDLLASLLFLFIVGAMLYFALFYIQKEDISRELPVNIYTDGKISGTTTISINGTFASGHGAAGKCNFSGRFIVPLAEKSGQTDVSAFIEWTDDGYQEIYFSIPGYLNYETGIRPGLYISPNMYHLAIELDDGTILATSDDLAELIALDHFYALEHFGTWGYWYQND